MKKFILSMIAACAMTTAVCAQDNAQQGERRRFDPAKMIEMRTQRMVETYKLTEEQAHKVKELNEKFMKNMGQRRQRPDADQQKPQNDEQKPQTERRSNRGGDNAQRPQGGQRGPRNGFGNTEEYNKELQQILTPEQYKQYQEDMEKMRQRRQQRRNS